MSNDKPSYQSLDRFTKGYIEALFFTEDSYTDRKEFESAAHQKRMKQGFAEGTLPSGAGFLELSQAAISEIISDCARFQEIAADKLEQAYRENAYDQEHAGRDFWFTRNGHGVGFWDRKLKNGIGTDLSGLCGWGTDFCEVNPNWESGEVHLY
ncbi:hypothetical protein [uncultured Sulfitobacter sp.]|uniref:hypothetical protein n=1 Tax=uncultured Sulfitobacter sp. TaxID=191468 RepID=UPI00259568E2|nr:hypothetical protein [uncultured Sulfitobacter sp.]